MKIGYARLGRLMSCDPGRWGVVGGDVEPPRLLQTLATRHPDDTFHLVGRTPPENPQALGMPDNVINPWIELDKSRRAWMEKPERQGTQLSDEVRRKFIEWSDTHVSPLYEDLDGLIVWLGQHGSVHAPGIPKVNSWWDDTVTPQDWAVLYGGPVIRGINTFRKRDPLKFEEVWLVSDARNYLKPHDLKWPLQHPILGQYEFNRDFWVQRYGDPRTPADVGFADLVKGPDKAGTHWKTNAKYVASNLEICSILPEFGGMDFNPQYDRPYHFGLFINEARAVSGPQRADIMRDWIRYMNPEWIHGKWSKQGLATAHVDDIAPLPAAEYFQRLRDTRCTITTPSSGSGWVTTKPWESFATGTVCFRYPGYDSQDHAYGLLDPQVRDWLSPPTAQDLLVRVQALADHEHIWRWLAAEQRRVYDEATKELKYVRMIEERIWK